MGVLRLSVLGEGGVQTRYLVAGGKARVLSSPGELPPEALAEPYVNLSAHTAPVPTPFVFS